MKMTPTTMKCMATTIIRTPRAWTTRMTTMTTTMRCLITTPITSWMINDDNDDNDEMSDNDTNHIMDDKRRQ